MKKERKKILWLVSWYPNKYDPFDGDFIQRHARAAALYDDIHVLFVKQHEQQSEAEQVVLNEEGLVEQRIYLPKKSGVPGKLHNVFQWWKVYNAQAEEVIRKKRPHLIHVHIPWKAGLIALWLSKKHRIDYLLTEHWGIYNKTVSDNIYTQPSFVRFFLKKIFSRAKAFVSVSRFLAEGVKHTLVDKGYTVLPNVVETSLFYPSSKKHGRFTFLHVSNMVPLKNVEGILVAFQQFLSLSGADAQLILIGNKDETYPKLAGEMNLLNTRIFFRGEILYSGVAKEMQKAHVFVLNSDMENSPCVICEALCAGLPVIATNVGGIPELLSAQDGILVSPRSVNPLVDAFRSIYEGYPHFDRTKIASAASQRFSYATVGALMHQYYFEASTNVGDS